MHWRIGPQSHTTISKSSISQYLWKILIWCPINKYLKKGEIISLHGKLKSNVYFMFKENYFIIVPQTPKNKNSSKQIARESILIIGFFNSDEILH